MGWPEFTDDDIRRIDNWVPDNADLRRRKLLPQILREWIRVDFRYHFSSETAAEERKRRERLARVGAIADCLSAALDGLDELDRWTLPGQIGVAKGEETCEAISNEKNRSQLNDTRSLVADLAAAAKQPLFKQGRGQPPNISAYLIMMDIAAIFEWLTTTAPARRIDRTTHDESGSFGDFAGAIWHLVFRSGYGFSAAIKNWASARKEFDERSMMIYNIAMRYAEWGILDRF